MNEKSSGSRSRKQKLTVVGTRCADHVTPLYPQKLALTSPTGGGRSVGIVRVRTKATEFSLVLFQVQEDSVFIITIMITTNLNYMLMRYILFPFGEGGWDLVTHRLVSNRGRGGFLYITRSTGD